MRLAVRAEQAHALHALLGRLCLEDTTMRYVWSVRTCLRTQSANDLELGRRLLCVVYDCQRIHGVAPHVYDLQEAVVRVFGLLSVGELDRTVLNQHGLSIFVHRRMASLQGWRQRRIFISSQVGPLSSLPSLFETVLLDRLHRLSIRLRLGQEQV